MILYVFEYFFGGTRAAFNLGLIIPLFWSKPHLDILSNGHELWSFPTAFWMCTGPDIVWVLGTIPSSSFGQRFSLLKVVSSNACTGQCFADYLREPSVDLQNCLSVKLSCQVLCPVDLVSLASLDCELCLSQSVWCWVSSPWAIAWKFSWQ